MNKTHIKYFDIGPYPVWFGFTDNEKAFLKECKRLGILDPPDFVSYGKDSTLHIFTKSGKLTMICTIRIDKETIDQILGLLTHEAVHVWQEICEFIGQKDKSGNEVEAYHIQNIAQFMFTEILKKKKFIK